MQSRPRKAQFSSQSESNTANVTSAVGREESFGRVRARRTSLFTRTIMWITGLVCTAFLLATLAQAWSNSNLMVRVQQEQQTLHQIQAEHDRLEQAAAYYKDPAVIESEARQQLGYIRPGEQPVVIINGDSQVQRQTPAQQRTTQRQGYWQDWWQTLFGNGGHR
ncbi:MAG: hypothetical protein NVS2B12_09410 [Ktedonobacteraceae bacterium]